MPEFGDRSKANIETVHPDLKRLFEEVVKTYDCSIICGYRGEDAQNYAYSIGSSRVTWPNSKHNIHLSSAIDVVPWPLDWENKKRFYHFAGYVWRVAESMGILVSWGGDWNRNLNLDDQNFFDLPHWELLGE